MKIIISENPDEDSDEEFIYKNFVSLEELEEYMKSRIDAVLYWFPEEKCLSIEDKYIIEMN